MGMTTYTDRFITTMPSRLVMERFRGIARRQGWRVEHGPARGPGEHPAPGARRVLRFRSPERERIELSLTPTEGKGTAVELIVSEESVAQR
jgi:hypothetical protein